MARDSIRSLVRPTFSRSVAAIRTPGEFFTDATHHGCLCSGCHQDVRPRRRAVERVRSDQALPTVSYSTMYPSARALPRTLTSRLTIVITCGASPSSSVVARCTASSVRIGSTGNGRRTRASTARSTSTMKQRRSKVRRARKAASSPADVNRPVARARMIARPASARARADVTRCVPAGAFRTAGSRSSNAATSALDSMYRMLAAATSGRRARVMVFRAERRGTLRFATIAVDQLSGGSRRQPNVGPVLEWVTSFHRRMKNAGCEEFLPPASRRRADTASWRHEFGDDAPVSGHRNPLACFNSPDVAAQVDSQLSDGCLHPIDIATCGHICNVRRNQRDSCMSREHVTSLWLTTARQAIDRAQEGRCAVGWACGVRRLRVLDPSTLLPAPRRRGEDRAFVKKAELSGVPLQGLDRSTLVSPVAPPRWWRRRSSSSTSSPRRRAWPQRHRSPAPRSACAG